jgi:ATP synthase protein I
VTTRAEPERDLMRRLLPLAVPAMAVATIVGGLLGGAGAAWSAALGIVAVAALFVASAFSIAWAARISPEILVVAGLGGFLVRLAAFTLALFALDALSWFSPVAFAAAFVPATIGLLVVEMKLVSGRMQADLWYFRERAS